MKKYKVSLHYEGEVEGEDEDDARAAFIEDVVYAPQSDFSDFVMDRLKVEPVQEAEQ